MALGQQIGNYLAKMGVEPLNFGKKNTITQAIWTGVIWGFAAFVVAWILAIIVINVVPKFAGIIIQIYSVMIVGLLGWKILEAHKATNNTMALAKVGLAAVLSFFFAYYVGVILLALFTTEKFHLLKDPKNMVPEGDKKQEESQQQ